MAPAPRIVELATFPVIGIDVRTSNARETEPATAVIPALWQRFHDEKVVHRIPSRVSTEVCFGVYTNYENGDAGAYTLIAGVEVSSLQTIPTGMVGAKIPASSYAVFYANGSPPVAIVNAWREIVEYFRQPGAPKRTFGADFEIYDLTKKNQAEIYIAIE